MVAGRHAAGPEQLPGDFPRVAIRQPLDQPRRIAFGIDDLRQRRARHVRVQFDAVSGVEAAVPSKQLVVQPEQQLDLGVVGERVDAQEPIAVERCPLRIRQRNGRGQGWRRHCFNAPTHMPCTKRRCVATYSTTTGSATITAAAAMPTRSVV